MKMVQGGNIDFSEEVCPWYYNPCGPYRDYDNFTNICNTFNNP